MTAEKLRLPLGKDGFTLKTKPALFAGFCLPVSSNDEMQFVAASTLFGYTVQNPVLAATWWLHEELKAEIKKPRAIN